MCHVACPPLVDTLGMALAYPHRQLYPLTPPISSCVHPFPPSPLPAKLQPFHLDVNIPVAMEVPIVLGSTTSIAHLCDVVIETIRRFAESSKSASDAVAAFRNEVQTLRRFLDLIERVHRAKPPRLGFEEEHWKDVKVLLARCRRTLSRLCKLLANLEAEDHEAARENLSRESQFDLQIPSVSALRAHIIFYTKTLQMSLQTVNL